MGEWKKDECLNRNQMRTGIRLEKMKGFRACFCYSSEAVNIFIFGLALSFKKLNWKVFSTTKCKLCRRECCFFCVPKGIMTLWDLKIKTLPPNDSETNLHANAETVGTTPKQQRAHFFRVIWPTGDCSMSRDMLLDAFFAAQKWWIITDPALRGMIFLWLHHRESICNSFSHKPISRNELRHIINASRTRHMQCRSHHSSKSGIRMINIAIYSRSICRHAFRQYSLLVDHKHIF